MTFEEYLTKYIKQYDKRAEPDELSFSEIMEEAENWHTQELKSMRSKGANTTNTKYSKEQRSEWAKRGTKARLQRKLNKYKNEKIFTYKNNKTILRKDTIPN